ncbi:MAG: hypothetical protein ACLUVC_13575 [Longibaculum sp.]
MKDFIIENKQLLISFVIISIMLPIIILLPSPIGFITYETGLTIIGYCGSILGGFLTLYGVWWTIKEQKKDLMFQQKNIDIQRQNDLAIQYKPIFSLEFSHSIVYNFLASNTAISFYLTFKNIGRGEATNINVNYSKYNPPYAFIISYEENQIIVQNNSCYLMITVSKTGKQTGEDTYEMASLDLNDKTELPISVKFNDSFGNQYIYDYIISFAYQAIIDSQDMKEVTIKDGNPILEMRDSTNTKKSELSWIATVSKPKIKYISKHSKKS